MPDVAVLYLLLVAATAVVAGATASVVGFGIGSLLTPVLAARYGTDLAIAAVALPHFAGSLLRGWRLRARVDRSVLMRFGLLSAAGGLIGALLFTRLAAPALGRVLGVLLLLTAAAGLAGGAERWRPRGTIVWLLGGLSGFFGGVVGNQGGLRAAALSTFGLAPATFVATSTVVGVLVDVARTFRRGTLRTVFRVILPASLPMILAGIWLIATAKGRRQRIEPVAGTDSVA